MAFCIVGPSFSTFGYTMSASTRRGLWSQQVSASHVHDCTVDIDEESKEIADVLKVIIVYSIRNINRSTTAFDKVAASLDKKRDRLKAAFQ